MERFKEKYDNKVQIRWDENTGTPKSIRKHRITGYSGTPLEIATQFLMDEKKMLGIDSVGRDLELKDSRTILDGATRVYFTQKFKDVNVLNAGYLVIIDPNGDIFKVSGDYYPDIKLESVLPSQSSEAVKSTIRSDIKEGTIESISDPDLGILPQVNEEAITYTLIYTATVSASDPAGLWEYTIDANTGTILDKNSLSFDVTGSGRVYLTDPDDCSYSTESLYRLTYSSPQYLNGENVIAYNYDTSEASSAYGTFIYSPANTHFDEVMVYYHVDMFENFLINLGMGGSRLNKVTVHTHYPYEYALTDYITRVIYFNDQNSNPDLLNPTKDAGVIAHEVMHCVTWTYCNMDDNLEEDSMNEALSDFFGVAYYNSNSANSTSWIGRYVDDDDYYNVERNLDNNYHYDDFGSIEWDNFYGSDEHDNGLIYSGALWDFRTDADTDEEEVDEIILSSLDIVDDVVNFEEGREAIEDAIDYGSYNEDYLIDVAEAFYAHGIGDPPPPDPVSVYISGPSSLEFKEVGTWTANVSDGYPPYSYQWYYKYDGSETWTALGTSSMEQLRMITTGFTMKVVVTDDEDETDEDTHHVAFGGEPKLIGNRNVKNIPDDFSLNQNYPNPFNPLTTIKFGLPKDTFVKLKIYDIEGHVIATLIEGNLPAGYHVARFDASSYSSGLYFYKIEAGSFTEVKRMLLIK
jgi:Zn-dependent metalloprotease